ncbi:oncostatin-M-specific receptor subunit beta [Mixophyes fleayi]|uniref:oncostatin-M-specific receptor subunit beta n=1 Tax=Mixophyes fleayi TaxID=3061075 RepID=UPI003F4DF0F4
MDHSTGLHGITIALFLTLKLGLWNCQEPAGILIPLNLKVHNDSSLQRLILEWNVSEQYYGSGGEIKFHIQVARSKNQNILLNEYYSTNLSRTGKPFRWTWDSQLPLECDSHSLRIRGTVLGENATLEEPWSKWSPWKTNYGQNKEDRRSTAIYPHEKTVLVGSNVTFCCLPRQNQGVREMEYKSKKYVHSVRMKTKSYTVTVRNVTSTRSDGENVFCILDNDETYGNVLIVSKPPDEPKHFSCITQDLQTLDCSWSPGDMYNFYSHLTVNYTLQEWLSQKSSSCPRDGCFWSIVRNQQIYNFTLTAKNIMGERSINAIVNLTERILPLDPSNLAVRHINASSVILDWVLKENYTSLLIICQTDLQQNLVTTASKGKMPSEFYSVSLTGLQPYTKYYLKVRCRSESSLAGWSNWSQVLAVRTHEDVPSGALDVWRQVEDSEGGRLVTLYWRGSPTFSANGIISHSNVRWWTLEGTPAGDHSRVSAQQNSSQIQLGTQAYAISVTAENRVGTSPATEIRIPRANVAEHVTAQRTSGRDGGVFLKWEGDPAVLGYVVEWCNVPRSLHCDLQWKKYNSSVDSDVVKSNVFRRGVRYNFWIYTSKEDGEHLLGKRTGYTMELVSSVKPKADVHKIDANSLILDWKDYPIDETQEGFVTGYNIYLRDKGGDCKLDPLADQILFDGSYVCRFSNDDPNKKQITIYGLRSNTTYEVAVTAITGGGETTAEFTKAHTPLDTGTVILPIILPVVIVSLLALALLFTGCWKRAWLKEMCYPDIPDPHKSKIFSFGASKGVADRTSIGCLPQKVDVVRIQENVQHKICDDVNNTTGNQLDLIYDCIQKNKETTCEDISPYFTNGAENAESLNQPPDEPLHVPQLTTYLEFFNQNYTTSPDDTLECLTSVGYRPQTDSGPSLLDDVLVQSDLNHLESTDLAASPDEVDVYFESFPAIEREPRSPTSITSTTFILVD